ncbi:MAG: permease-like cell division protein FtsX [Fastidiosipilaceae bacterium]|jgi:cell division transport system permease protein|nr:ABC transporter permease [Clostridiaceae bacterium]
MRIRTILNSIKESFKNIGRHPLVALASVTTIALMLILMGSFVGISLNATHIAEAVGTKPPIEIWVRLDAEDADIAAIDQSLANDVEVIEYVSVTPEENFAQLKEEMGENASALENFDGDNLLPHLFQVRLLNPEKSEEFANRMLAFPGVSRVDYSANVMSALSRLIRWVNLATLIAFAVLCVISLFIIANMVRVSILARGEEISIMKYVGATNSYIRMPYILEGAIVGLIGATIAIVVVYFAYEAIYGHIMVNTSANSFYALMPVEKIIYPAAIVNLVLGVFIGAVGSFTSVRRYIKV